MRARGWILTRSGERSVVPEPFIDKEEIFWPLKMPQVKPGQHYPMMDQEPYRRHLLEGHNIFLYIPVEMYLKDVPKDIIEEILGEI